MRRSRPTQTPGRSDFTLRRSPPYLAPVEFRFAGLEAANPAMAPAGRCRAVTETKKHREILLLRIGRGAAAASPPGPAISPGHCFQPRQKEVDRASSQQISARVGAAAISSGRSAEKFHQRSQRAAISGKCGQNSSGSWRRAPSCCVQTACFKGLMPRLPRHRSAPATARVTQIRSPGWPACSEGMSQTASATQGEGRPFARPPGRHNVRSVLCRKQRMKTGSHLVAGVAATPFGGLRAPSPRRFGREPRRDHRGSMKQPGRLSEARIPRLHRLAAGAARHGCSQSTAPAHLCAK